MTREEELIIKRLFKSYFQEDITALAEKKTDLTEDARDIVRELKADSPIINDEGTTWEGFVTLYLLGACRGFDLALKINSMGKQAYTVDEAADAMRVSKQTVYNKIKQGKIKATKRGKSYIIQRQDIEPYIIGE